MVPLPSGSSGPRLIELQERLEQLCIDSGAIDGRFAAATEAAVLAFEKILGLSADRQGTSAVVGLREGASPIPKRPGIDPRIGRVTALMHSAMHRKLPLRDLAGAAGLSVSRVCHLFKSHHGIGPARYLKLLRMRRAKELIEASVLSVKEIGVRLGYDDPSRFVEDFRKMFGSPPLRYREQMMQAIVSSPEADGRPLGTDGRQN